MAFTFCLISTTLMIVPALDIPRSKDLTGVTWVTGRGKSHELRLPTSSLDCIFFDLFCSRRLSIMLHAVEIVRAVHSPQGTMIRATIAE